VAKDLPIGSGEIESAHRYIAQQRLKRPGAWWRVKHAEYMFELRVTGRGATGTLTGPVSVKADGPRMAQISTDQPYHENPQGDCITLDRTPPAPNEVMSRVAFPHRGPI
jgi:hypothetical protein